MPDHFIENTELAVGATSAIVAADQLLQATDPEEDKTSHLVKARIGAAIAIGAFELLRRQNEMNETSQERHPRQLRRSGSYERSQSRSPSTPPSHSLPRSSSRSRSRSKHVKHHKRHMIEEIIGAYSLGKEMMGDRRHHVTHLVGEALGAAGVYQELRARDKQDEEERRRK